MPAKKKYGKLKKVLLVILALVAVFFIYVEVVNRNSVNMTYRQKLLKAVYPLWMWWSKAKGKNAKELTGNAAPPVSFYSLPGTLNDGSAFDMASLKGKKALLVNTASNCGYTNQYEDLEKLAKEYKDKLVVIGFPSNDFKQQEQGSDADIAAFCKNNFNISFPLMKKSAVRKGDAQNKIFNWLTDPSKNGWNNQEPSWNFCKYLVDEEGRLSGFYGSGVSPYDKQIINAINQ